MWADDVLRQLADQGPADHQSLHNWLASIQTPQRFARELAQSVAPSLLSLSYHHENGFIKLFLAQYKGYRVIAHLWDSVANSERSSIESTYDVHNHRWHFVSVSLRGCLIMEHFTEGDDNDPEYTEYRYQSPGAEEHAAFVRQGRRHLRNEFATIIAEGHSFSLDDRCLHRAYPAPSECAITLVIQAPPTRSCTEVFTVTGPIAAPALQVRRLEDDELCKYRDDLLGSIT